MRPVLALISKEFRLDWKSGHAIGSIVLYVLSTCYVVYLAFLQITDAHVWNALLWVIILFAAFNVVTRSYDQDSNGREIYLYTLCSPQTVFLAKSLYSILLMTGVALFTACAFSFFLPLVDNDLDIGLFALGIVAGSSGLACVLSLIAGISWKTGNRSGMTAILGFPLILPLLLSTIRYSESVVSGATWSMVWKNMLAIVSVELIGLLVGYLLFPYIWRE